MASPENEGRWNVVFSAAVVLFVMQLIIPISASASNHNGIARTDIVGGSWGDNQFEVYCEEDHYITHTELGSSAGGFAEEFRFKCSSRTASEHWINTTDWSDWTPHDDTGVESVEAAQCPEGSYVTGIRGTMGPFLFTPFVVQDIFLECWPRQYGQVDSPDYTLELGLSAIHTLDVPTFHACPSGYGAVGVFGKSGQVMDSIGLICKPFPGYIPPSDVPILLVHGIINSAQEEDEYHTNCKKYFESFISGFTDERRALVTIGYYAGDLECDLYIEGYQSVTNNTSISDIADAFAMLVKEQFHDNDVPRVQVAAHSMGGLITRDAIDRYGSDLNITDVATFGTPHNGAAKATLCTLVPWTASRQCEEMKEGSDFLSGLEENPQSATQGTHWMLVGSDDDEGTGPDTTVAMGNGPDTRPEVRIEYYKNTAFVGNSCDDQKNKVGHSQIISSKQMGTCENGQYQSLKNPVDHALDFF